VAAEALVEAGLDGAVFGDVATGGLAVDVLVTGDIVGPAVVGGAAHVLRSQAMKRAPMAQQTQAKNRNI
jgi:hypothetical protein